MSKPTTDCTGCPTEDGTAESSDDDRDVTLAAEEYIKAINSQYTKATWTTEEVKTVVAGNIHNFASSIGDLFHTERENHAETDQLYHDAVNRNVDLRIHANAAKAKLAAAEAVIAECYMVISEYQMFFVTPESTKALKAIKAWEEDK